MATYFFIPISEGGLGLKGGILNGKVTLSESAGKLVRTKVLSADILWDKDRVAFEYDSTMTHMDEEQRRYDCNRQSAMGQSGYTVIRATWDNFQNFRQLENLAEVIRKSLKIRQRDDRLKKYEKKRYEVAGHLFWNK